MKEKAINRRAFLKGLTLTGVISAVGAKPKKARAASRKRHHPEQTLYRETEAFRRYYESLKY
ncbi:MAG: twin-arginine translocation signal domain-containing protein [Nitrospirae bacterium]|nr:MAG: twin-arginine translocation signal domain-containing protein [Nitrospirota bacterium]